GKLTAAALALRTSPATPLSCFTPDRRLCVSVFRRICPWVRDGLSRTALERDSQLSVLTDTRCFQSATHPIHIRSPTQVAVQWSDSSTQPSLLPARRAHRTVFETTFESSLSTPAAVYARTAK